MWYIEGKTVKPVDVVYFVFLLAGIYSSEGRTYVSLEQMTCVGFVITLGVTPKVLSHLPMRDWFRLFLFGEFQNVKCCHVVT